MMPDLYKNAIWTEKLVLSGVPSEKEESHWYASEDDPRPIGKQPEFNSNNPYYHIRQTEVEVKLFENLKSKLKKPKSTSISDESI